MSTIIPGFNRRPQRQAKAEPEPEPEGVACQDCGILVTDPDAPIEVVEAAQREVRLPLKGSSNGPVVIENRAFESRLTTCAVCREREEDAARIAKRHPSLLAHLQHEPTRVRLISAALLVLDVIGVDWRDLSFEQQISKRLRLIVNQLPNLTQGLPWWSNFTPVLRAGFVPDSYASKENRWSFLREDQVQKLRDGYGAVLQDVMDGPRVVKPPTGEDGRKADVRGCMFCGIGSVSVLASAAHSAWGELRAVQPAVVGGKRRPEPVRGYLCPVCRQQADKVGSLGMTAIEQAIAAYLGINSAVFERYEGKGDYAEGLRITLGDGDEVTRPTPPAAWCTLPKGTPTNARPWQHLGDLSELREGLAGL